VNKLLKTGLTCLTSTLLVTSSLSTFAASKDYSSAEIYTADSWLYGKYMFRMRAAEGSGILSNFFLWKPESETSAVDWEEVDIEVFGKEGAKSLQSNIITDGTGWTTSEQVHTQEASFADDYHTFSLEWTPDYVAWYVDGVELRRTEGGQAALLNNAAQLRFNFWASQSTGWVGDFDDSILPVHMYVNWIEYYSWNGEGFDLGWRDDFNDFDTNRWSEANWTFDGNYVDFVPENSNISDGYLVLSITENGQEGFNGNVPLDPADSGVTDPGEEETTPGEEETVPGEEETVPGEEETAPGEEETTPGEGNDSGIGCTYTVVSEWNAGFVANIAVTNNSDATIDGWSVSWEYSDDSSVNHPWSASVSGSSQYTATNLSWNANLAPGQSTTFGFTGNKDNGDAQIPSLSCEQS